MENFINQLKFDEKGLIPAIAQDINTNEVLMMAYMNSEAVEKTMETGIVHYFSRSRNALWKKGETSGHFQHVKSISVDCDNDTLLIKVQQVEAACHTGHYSCFYRTVGKEGISETSEAVFDPAKVYSGKGAVNAAILQELYDVIVDRKENPKEGSYTNYLFTKGVDKILKKVGEETAEVIIASKNDEKGEIVYEVSDLMYHLFVLMVERGVELDDIFEELKKRR